MPFNLRKARSDQAISKIRKLPGCDDIRHSDVDGIGEEIHEFLKNTLGKTTKVAVHGYGETWTPVPADYNPYNTSPLVNNPGPEFGGRWRENFPGAGGQHINDDGDTKKNTRGEGAAGLNPLLERRKIDQMHGELEGKEYIVRKRVDEKSPEKESKSIFGDEGQYDGDSIFVVVKGWENAMKIQGMVPGSMVEPKGA